MKTSTKGLIWGLGIVLLGVGTYFLTKKILDKNSEDMLNAGESPSGEAGRANPLAAAAPAQTKKKTNTSLWLKKGMTDSEDHNEIETLQKILNQTIKACRLVRWTDKMDDYSKDLKSWVTNMAERKYLDEDGDFGEQTELATQALMGTKQTNVCQARMKRRDLVMLIGFENPYKSWSSIC